MARRTKGDALATRHKLLDAAEHLFQAQGVSRTSLQDIARRAGATRGAVYWHFKDKADLFNAMMQRVSLPMEESFLDPEDTNVNALDHIRQATHKALKQIVTDAQTRRVFEVATQKVEYIQELQAVRLRHLAVRNGFLKHIERSMDAAASHSGVQLPATASMVAQGLHALIDGLIQNWLLDPDAFDLLEIGQCAINVYLCGLGFASSQVISVTPGSIPESP